MFNDNNAVLVDAKPFGKEFDNQLLESEEITRRQLPTPRFIALTNTHGNNFQR